MSVRLALLASLFVACASDPQTAPADVLLDASSDAGPDAAADVFQDAAPDSPAIDAVAVPDVLQDASRDTDRDADAVDVVRDAPGDASDVTDARGVDAATDAGDPLGVVATALSIAFRDGADVWTMPHAQTCQMTGEGTTAGSVISFGADFDVTSPGSGFGVAGTLPTTGHASLSVGSETPTDVTARRGIPYLVGAATRRVNASVAAMLAGRRLEVTILGCEVR